jgi:hypothetical protein
LRILITRTVENDFGYAFVLFVKNRFVVHRAQTTTIGPQCGNDFVDSVRGG